MNKLLIPAEGTKVRKPDGKHLDPAGEIVEMSSYWARRLASGDVAEQAIAAKRSPRAGAASNQTTANQE